MSSSRAADVGGISALTFSPGTAGSYSWKGLLGVGYWSSNAGGSLIFGKIHASNTFEQLHRHEFNYTATIETHLKGGTIDLGDIRELQSVPLQPNEKLTVSLHPGYHTANGAYFLVDGDRVSIEGGGFLAPIPMAVIPVSNASTSVIHVIDGASTGEPIDRRIMGLTAGDQVTVSIIKDPQTQVRTSTITANDDMFRSGMLVRGPYKTAEDSNWKTARKHKDSSRTPHTTLEFLQMAAAKGLVPMLTIETAGQAGFSVINGVTTYNQFAPAGGNGVTYPLNPDQIAALARHAADYVRYTNYILQHYKDGDPIPDERDRKIVESIGWMAGDDPNSPQLLKLPRPIVGNQNIENQIPPKVIYWEIGNEPDHHLTKYVVETDQTIPSEGAGFDAVYAAISQAMLAEDPDIKVGPAFGDAGFWGQPEVSSTIFNIFADGNEQRVDFVSIHPYMTLISYYAALYNATVSGEDVDIYNAKKEAEWGLRSIRGAGRISWARNYLFQKIGEVSSGQQYQSIEVFAGEHDPMNWIKWVPNEVPATCSYPQYTMYSALGLLESIFTFHDWGYDGACFWDFIGLGDGIQRPCHPFYQELGENLGDSLIYKYAPTVDYYDPRSDSVRVYATRTTNTGKLAVWCSNMYHDREVTVRLAIRGVGVSPSITRKVLRNPSPIRDLSGFYENPPDDGSLIRPNDGYFNQPNQSIFYFKDPLNLPFTVPHTLVQWNVEPFEMTNDLSNFEVRLPPATITLFEVQP